MVVDGTFLANSGMPQTDWPFSQTQKLNYPVFNNHLDDAEAILQQHFAK